MILGHVRDLLPRVTFRILSEVISPAVEFVVVTGFDGELTLPARLIRNLTASFVGERPIWLADGSLQSVPTFTIELGWNGEPRMTEVLERDGNPLLGAELLSGSVISIEMIDGGEVTVEPL